MDHSSLLRCWGLTFKKILPEVVLCGSPERCYKRSAVLTEGGKVYVLEQIVQGTLERKKEIAQMIHSLDRRGLRRVHPYLISGEGTFQVKHEEGYWQIMPFIEGEPLPRPSFARDAWRGDAFARFLIDLRSFSSGLADDEFNLLGYVDSLEKTITAHRGAHHQRFASYFRFLKQNVPEDLPIGFCHGDIHPLNAIWGKQDIRSIIDWEFFGNKPELYDAANLVGCIGIEDPEFLFLGMVPSFIRTLKTSGFGDPESWRHFVSLVIAVRAGWISEWFRKGDLEMLDLEAAYVDVLIERHKDLQNRLLIDL